MSALDLVLLVLLGAIWGASFPFIRVAAPELGPLPLAEARVLIAATALLLWLGLVVRERPRVGRWRELFVLGALNNAIPFTTIGAAELVLTASLGAILNATSPFFTVALRAVVERRRPLRTELVGTVVGFSGVVVLVGGGTPDPSPAVVGGVALMLVGALGYAAAAIYASRTFRDTRQVDLALGQFLACAVIVLLPALATLPPRPPSTAAVASTIALAVLGSAVAYLIYFRLIARAGPTRAIAVTFLIPVFGVLFGHLFLGEAVGPGLVAGGGLVLAGVALVTRPRIGARLA